MFEPGNVENKNANITSNLFHVDFTQPHLCERTVPVSCSICRSNISMSGRQSWPQLLVAITEMFITKNNPNLESLYHHSLNSRSTHPFFMDNKLERHNCARLSNGKWIDLNYSIPRLIDIIGKLCVFCGVGLEDVQIYYIKKGTTELQDAAAFAQQGNIMVEKEISATVTSRPTIREAIIKVLQSSQQGMNVEEIYNKIIADGLYSFGAQNPQDVVRVEIDRACVNSNYTVRASKDCFRFERNQNGEKVYFLLPSTLTDDTAQTTLINTILADPKVESITSTTVDENVKSAIVSILEERFPNGIRPNSVIDKNKLKFYYFEVNGEAILFENIDIPSLLNSIGIRHGEKVFAISQNGKKKLAELLDRLIAEDNHLFYYDEFYEIHADFLQKIHIFSSALLRTVLINVRPSLFYTRNSFSTQHNVTVESDVLRCFKNAVCLSYEQLKSKLPYVPLDKVKQVLAQNSNFVWVETGVYTHTCKLEIDFNELNTIEMKIKAELSKYGYVSIASLNVSSSLELNPELSETAVKNGLFQVCLADRYEKRGNIITPKGIALNSVVVFEDYCLTRDLLTLDELFNFEKEINGSINSQSLFVAYETMVRVDKDTFVSDRKIFFDVEATDNALTLFINAEVIPLRAVTSFTSFPYVEGYPWNLFLLESYCRRFSKQFKFQCLSVSSKNVGAIFRKSAGFTDYAAVLANAVANADVRLIEKEVGDFLFDSGYIARRTGVMSNVIAQAQILRKRIV